MDCDQIIYIGLFLMIGLFLYKRMYSRGGQRIPRGYNLEPAALGSVGGDSVGGCPANIMRGAINNNVGNNAPKASEEYISNDEVHRTVNYGQQGANTQDMVNKSCYPQTILSSKDLLPGNIQADISKFTEEAKNNIGEGIMEGINYLDAGFHIGVNTVGQSLRNSNKQLRSEPANPQVSVSPWLNTTIGADLDRRPLESGSCAR